MTLRLISVRMMFWKVSTELLETPQQLVTRGFLELAAEARIVRVEKNQSFLLEEVLPQITEVTRPMCEPVYWMIEEDLGQSVESLCEGTARVPTVRFDVGQLSRCCGSPPGCGGGSYIASFCPAGGQK